MNLLDDFELEDNAIIGGIAGFVEDSVEREQPIEESEESELPSNNDALEIDGKNDRLRLLYNQDPNFALHIVNRFIEHKRVAKLNLNFKMIMAEIEDEIEQMREDEENANRNDC